MASFSRVVDVDGVAVYVKVIIKGRRIDIVWDKNLPPSTIRRLLLLIMPHVIGLLQISDSNVKHGRSTSMRIHVFKYHDGDYAADIANRKCLKKLRA